jgi:hypothetical protein
VPQSRSVMLACAMAAFFSAAVGAQTVPATIPAPDTQAAAKSALTDFYHAMCQGDPKAPDMLVFADPKTEKIGRVVAKLALAQQRVHLAAVRAFGDAANALALGAGEKDRQQFDKDLQQAAVTVIGASAQVRTPSGDTYVLALKDGTWKVDFDKTQANMGPLPREADLPAIDTQIEAFDKLAADLAEDAKTADPARKRIPSFADLKTRVRQIPSPPLPDSAKNH